MSKSKALHFFATKRDLEAVIAAVESDTNLEYVRTALSESPSAWTTTSGLLIPNLGIAVSGDQAHEASFIVVRANEIVASREVRQRRGGILYAFDQEANPSSISFRPGGVYQACAVIAGQIGTCTNHPGSLELLNFFARQIRRQFKRIKSFYVGPEAEELLNAGYRLTVGVNSSREIDLVRD